MQNNVKELSQRLLRSLDTNYNVIDMPAVFEIISVLDHTSITEELLKTTRLGKYINELRRKTTNENLAKRAKGLLKKWRGQVLPPSNGTTTATVSKITTTPIPKNNAINIIQSPITAATINHAVNNKKRPLSSLSIDDTSSNKRIKYNGTSELLYISSDNSNSCDLRKNQNVNPLDETTLTFTGRVVVPPPVVQQEPKKRGRKKGSKNHKTLLVQAEESFTNKMAVSVNSKVKTTQELLASIQNKNLVIPKKEVKIESPKIKIQPESDDDVIVIIDPVKLEEEEEESIPTVVIPQKIKKEEEESIIIKKENTIEDILLQLPKVDYSKLNDSPEPECRCSSEESIFDVPDNRIPQTNPECPARLYYQQKYLLGNEYVTESRINQLHNKYLDQVNGNKCDKSQNPDEPQQKTGLFTNIVPNFYENLTKECCDSSSSNSLSPQLDNPSTILSDNNSSGVITRDNFREFHECVSLRTYNDELLHILPYVVLD